MKIVDDNDPNRGPSPGATPAPSINLNDATDVECDECQSKIFVERLMIKKVSKFLTGAPRDTISPIPVLACAKCSHVNKEFMPDLSKL